MLDAYNRHARLAPALITLAPVTALSVVLGLSLASWSSTAPLVAAASLHVLAVHHVRDLGYAQQERLWRRWDGPPTTHLLRWREAINLPLMTQRHRDVARVTGKPLPTRDEEARDLRAADERYEAAANWIKDAARGDGFEFVARQNADYGFRRNMYGCRVWAIRVSAVAIIAAILFGFLGMLSWTAVMVSSLAFVAWAFFLRQTITADFVRRAADRYAQALMGAVHQLRRT